MYLNAYSDLTPPIYNPGDIPVCAKLNFLQGGNDSKNFFPLKVEVNFGTDCVNANGIEREGKVTFEISNYLIKPDSTLKIVRGDNYFINGRKVEGTILHTNTTKDPKKPTWTRAVTNGKITTLTGLQFLYEGSKTITLASGANNDNLLDDVYHITAGFSKLTRPSGLTLTSTIQETVVKPYSCLYITQGVVGIKGTIIDGVINYGNGTCDNEVIYKNSVGVEYKLNF